MPLLQIELPEVAAGALLDAARAASLTPEELLIDALRALPLFQAALCRRPEMALSGDLSLPTETAHV